LRYKKKIIYHDNSPAHKSVLAKRNSKDLYYEFFKHPPYSPDLAPSELSLFPKLKLFLAGQGFFSNQETIASVERNFADLTKKPLQGQDNCAGASLK
jgi:histone-lysine N-methyltransferase SETMAR